VEIENQDEDEIVIYVLRKSIQILHEEGLKPQQFEKENNWSISPESFDVDKPL